MAQARGPFTDAAGVVIRSWRTDADDAAMAAVSNACTDVDRLDAFAGPEGYRFGRVAGGGRNGIPTGKPFYGILRAYQPVQGAQIKPTVRKR